MTQIPAACWLRWANKCRCSSWLTRQGQHLLLDCRREPQKSTAACGDSSMPHTHGNRISIATWDEIGPAIIMVWEILLDFNPYLSNIIHATWQKAVSLLLVIYIIKNILLRMDPSTCVYCLNKLPVSEPKNPPCVKLEPKAMTRSFPFGCCMRFGTWVTEIEVITNPHSSDYHPVPSTSNPPSVALNWGIYIYNFQEGLLMSLWWIMWTVNFTWRLIRLILP